MPDSDADLQRLTLYLPARLLERAEAQARAAGAESLQMYCEALLREALEQADQPAPAGAPEGRGLTEEWVDELVSDPAYLAEWAIPPRAPDAAEGRDLGPSGLDTALSGRAPAIGSALVERAPEAERAGPVASARPDDDPSAVAGRAAEVVLRHAALHGDDPEGLIARLRRGEPIDAGPAQELLQALIDLEQAFHDSDVIDRRLAFALHRLIFEGQVLLTDAWPGLTPDPGTVETLRLVQEAVDRVLSGEDIRYYRDDPDDPPGPIDPPE